MAGAAAVWISFLGAGLVGFLQGYSFAKFGYPSAGGLIVAESLAVDFRWKRASWCRQPAKSQLPPCS